MRTIIISAITAVLVGVALVLTGVFDSSPAPDLENVEITLGDDGNPLRGEVVVPTSTDSTVSVAVTGAGQRLIVRAREPGAPTTSVPLLGLRPDTTYTVTVEVDGTRASTRASTGPLPDFFPPVRADVPRRGSDPGLTLLDVRFWGADEEQRRAGEGFVVAVDGAGAPVWYLRTPRPQEDAQRTERGTILFTYDEGAAREYAVTGELRNEWAGNVVRETVTEDPFGDPIVTDDAVPVETDQMHHAVSILPDGNILTLSREVREISGFSEQICDAEDSFDGSYRVGGDVVVEFDPVDGEIVREWPLLDYAGPLDDPERIVPTHFCGAYLNPRYPGRAPVRDWSHANAVVHDGEHNRVLVSLRHLDQVWAFRDEDDEVGPAGELLWRLGRGGDFDLEEGEWFHYQHAPEVQADGSLLIYDNGNYRPGTSTGGPDALPWSRAVRYTLDTGAMTASQEWQHRVDDGDGRPVYAPFLGDADRVPGGGILISHGGAVTPPSHEPLAEGVLQYARLVEVDPASDEVVWDVSLRDPGGGVGWSVYRAERIEALYPPSFEVSRSVED